MEISNYEQFKSRQIVRYKLTTTVNDEVVYESSYADADDLISDGIRKSEYAVRHQISMNFDDNEDMRLENETD